MVSKVASVIGSPDRRSIVIGSPDRRSIVTFNHRSRGRVVTWFSRNGGAWTNFEGEELTDDGREAFRWAAYVVAEWAAKHSCRPSKALVPFGTEFEIRPQPFSVLLTFGHGCGEGEASFIFEPNDKNPVHARYRLGENRGDLSREQAELIVAFLNPDRSLPATRG
jgi:hypothetical protein